MDLTPMMRHYMKIKDEYKDELVFYRLGDFYELFFEDAKIASRELELVLTGKDCGLSERAPMCGVPFHAAENYIGRLVNKGYKVCICEQMEDPKDAKGIVKRDVVKVITPGTLINTSYLEDKKNNYILCVFVIMNQVFLSFCDILTGEFKSTAFVFDEGSLISEISKVSPSEIILFKENKYLEKFIKDRIDVIISFTDDDESNMDDILQRSFSNAEQIQSYGLKKVCLKLIKYIEYTQKSTLSHIDRIDFYSTKDFMTIDLNSKRNLELLENLRDKSKKGSLLWILDETITSIGGRTLRKWIELPLYNERKIKNRLDSVEELKNDVMMRGNIKEALSSIYDMERILGKVCSKSVNAKELIALKNSLSNLPNLKDTIKNCSSTSLKYVYENLDLLEDIYDILEKSIMDSPAISIKEGDIIKDGFNKEIDELRLAKKNGKTWVLELEAKEREFTGIKSLKIGYNKVFGYYIEITKANYNSIPEGRYIRKQTLANAERFITEDLKNIEEKILNAESSLNTLEYDVFVSVRENVESAKDRIKKTSYIIGVLDAMLSLAIVAENNNYVKPIISNNGEILIKEGRHPVVEKILKRGDFVPNDTKIDVEENQMAIITGPNMAGKSTYMRQVALMVIMAHMGSYVPASYASISICDKIFTRIGASDDLVGGKSTFMVEMWEVANILQNATNKSLIILDEVGRGTSTFDGLSIAWAVVEYICTKDFLKCKTLFATHYHEIIQLENSLKGVKNYSIKVKKLDNDIIFLRKIIKGGADESYGIDVARLAGVPEEVIKRANEILKQIEKEKLSLPSENDDSVYNNEYKDKIEDEQDLILDEIRNLDIMNLTPMQALSKLYDIYEKLKK